MAAFEHAPLFRVEVRRRILRGMKTRLVLVLILVPTLAHGQVRPLSTDRPDRTESPYSVPKGWFQFESDLVSGGRIEIGAERITALSLVTINAKYGVFDNVDLQFVFSPFVRIEAKVNGLSMFQETGSGHAGLRVKWNLAGNDDDGPAFAVLPFALVPTRGDAIFDQVTWGMVTPFAIGIGADASFSAMLGFSRVNNAETFGIASATLGRPIAGDFSGFVELFYTGNGFGEDDVDDTTFDAGITYAPSPDWQFDTGVYLGLTDTSEDWRVFVGASARFPLRR